MKSVPEMATSAEVAKRCNLNIWIQGKIMIWKEKVTWFEHLQKEDI